MTRWEELEQLRERARARGIPVARPQTFRLLLDTVRSLNPERILEIGTAVGCSARRYAARGSPGAPDGD